jgi:hypothetical protein
MATNPSPLTFRLIQFGTAAILVALLTAVYAWLWSTHGSDVLAGLFIGAALSGVGVYMSAMAAPRIHDPSRTVTLDRYEGHRQNYREHGDGMSREVHMERKAGEETATYSRQQAVKLTLRGIALAAIGPAIAYALTGM